jgi:hypothetical protein
MKLQTRLTQTQLTNWTTALRSGFYSQGQRHLNQHNRFCVMGVLCETLHGLLIKKPFDGHTFSYEETASSTPGYTSSFPKALGHFFGVGTNGTLPTPVLIPDPEIPHRVYRQEYSSLMDLNDRANYSFEQLADLIESTYLPDQHP